jgi:hypothetical protein
MQVASHLAAGTSFAAITRHLQIFGSLFEQQRLAIIGAELVAFSKAGV